MRMRVAAHSQSHRATVASPVIQTAHYAMAVASTAGPSEPSRLLVNGLTSRNLSTVLLERAHFGNADLVRCAAAKSLCIDDQLYRLNGGSEFARMSIAAARRAGRTAVLLCADMPTVFINRREIFASFGGELDYVVGEPSAVLSLFGLSRVDTLVPRLMQIGTGLVLHRANYPSISVKPKSNTFETSGVPISRVAFWSQFVPSIFDEFLVSATV